MVSSVLWLFQLAGTILLRVRIPTLGLNNIYEGIPYAGPVPAVGDVVFVSSLEGKSGSFVAFTGVAYEGNTGAPTGDITSVVAGTNLNGGGTAGEVTLNLDNEISISGDLTVGGSFNIVPAGTVVMHGAGTAPSGWLACDGSAVSRTTYADLFASIGTRYGSGDGSTTFNLPVLLRLCRWVLLLVAVRVVRLLVARRL